MRLLTDVSTVIAGGNSRCPAIVRLLPDVSMGATNETGCRYAGKTEQGAGSDKGQRKDSAWQSPLRMTRQ